MSVDDDLLSLGLDFHYWKLGTVKDGVWKGFYQCLVCEDNVWRDKRSLMKHVNTGRHEVALAYFKANEGRKSSTVTLTHTGQRTALRPKERASRLPQIVGREASSGKPGNKSCADDFTKSHALPTLFTKSTESCVSSTLQSNRVYSQPCDQRDCYSLWQENTQWFPWPDKKSCVLDIMYHLPGLTYSDKQNRIISWSLETLLDSPSPFFVDPTYSCAALQHHYGVQTVSSRDINGEVFYINDINQMIAQELANPNVRPYVEFYPEDAGALLARSSQAWRWLYNMEAEITTPMIRQNNEDLYLFEPVILANGDYCVPIRWFKRSGELYARVCRIHEEFHEGVAGWVFLQYDQLVLPAKNIMISFTKFIASFESRHIADPRIILGIRNGDHGDLVPWTLSDPSKGNKWRVRASGHRVMAFPIWLYCRYPANHPADLQDKMTIVFAPAGLDYERSMLDYNMHFLCTSNIAEPSDMLLSVVSQIEQGQKSGIWAWDYVFEEVVLVIPSIFSILHDNPVQLSPAAEFNSEEENLCRICPASSSEISATKFDNGYQPDRRTDAKWTPSNVRNLRAMGTSPHVNNVFTGPGGMDGPVTVLEEECALKSCRSKTCSRDLRAASGEDLSGSPETLLTKSGLQQAPNVMEIPAELLQMPLLIWIKRVWVNTLSSFSAAEKTVLESRLTSVNITGLGFPRPNAKILVFHVELLTEEHTEAIAQLAPYVLYDLIPYDLFNTWLLLCTLVSLIRQEEITDLNSYMNDLTDVMNSLVHYIERLFPSWKDEPAFHQIVHLPLYILYLGPASLFAIGRFKKFSLLTENFNIRDVHRNVMNEVGKGFAEANRIRHLLSGGKFRSNHKDQHIGGDLYRNGPSRFQAAAPNAECYRGIGDMAEKLREQYGYIFNSYGFPFKRVKGEGVTHLGNPATGLPERNCRWDQTLSSKCVSGFSAFSSLLMTKGLGRCLSFHLLNGDECSLGDWIIAKSMTVGKICVAKVLEILQVSKSDGVISLKPDYVLLQIYTADRKGDVYYHMPILNKLPIFELNEYENLYCVVNVQHNCRANECQQRNANQTDGMDILHINPEDFLLNYTQIRNHKYIQLFSTPRSNGQIHGELAAQVTRSARDISNSHIEIQSTRMI